jgi:hypothetical protein
MKAVSPEQTEDHGSLPSPVDWARLLAALVTELIPGGNGWPSATEAGVHGLVAMRICSDWDEADIRRLAAAMTWDDGAFVERSPEERVASIGKFEASEPALFDVLYNATVLAYYETPFVVAAIRRTGRPYSARPHVHGYPMAPFEFNRDMPNHARGRYLRTDDVRPVDISGLDLETIRTERWGVQR